MGSTGRGRRASNWPRGCTTSARSSFPDSVIRKRDRAVAGRAAAHRNARSNWRRFPDPRKGAVCQPGGRNRALPPRVLVGRGLSGRAFRAMRSRCRRASSAVRCLRLARARPSVATGVGVSRKRSGHLVRESGAAVRSEAGGSNSFHGPTRLRPTSGRRCIPDAGCQGRASSCNASDAGRKTCLQYVGF